MVEHYHFVACIISLVSIPFFVSLHAHPIHVILSLPIMNPQTSTSCKLADGTDCKDFMLGLKNKCTKFRATFTAKACNEMNRGMFGGFIDWLKQIFSPSP